MSIRITQGILFNQALSDLNRSLRGSTSLQRQIATGLRVIRPSDDPASALRILPLSSEILRLDQMLGNTSVAREALNTGAASLEDASNTMARIRELTIQGANDTVSAGDRRNLAEEIDQMLQQLLSVANAQHGGRFLFGGTVSDAAPFELVDTASGTRVEYRGNDDTLSIEVAPGVRTAINEPGESIFLQRQRGATRFDPAGTTGATPGAGVGSGVGFDALDISFAGLTVPGGTTGIALGSGTTTALGQLNYTFTAPDQFSINGGPAVTVSAPGDFTVPVGPGAGAPEISLNLTPPIAPGSGTLTARAAMSLDSGATTSAVDFSTTEVRVRDSDDGSVLDVDVSALTRVGQERVIYEGTFDVFTTVISIRDVLRNSDNLPRSEVTARLSSMLDELDTAHERVLDGLRSLGFRSQTMDVIGNRVSGLQQTSRESLSIERDTDIVDAIVEFNRQDTVYRAALQIGSRVVQTSLLDFLR